MWTVSPRGGSGGLARTITRFNTKKQEPFRFYPLDYHPEKNKSEDNGTNIDLLPRKELTSTLLYGQYFLIFLLLRERDE